MRRLVVPDCCQIRIDGSALVLQLPEGSLDNTKSLHMREITKRFVICAIVTTIWNKLACHSPSADIGARKNAHQASLPTTGVRFRRLHSLSVCLPAASRQQRRRTVIPCQDKWSDAAAGSVARRWTNSTISNRFPGASFRKAVSSRKLSTVSLDGAPSFVCSSATDVGFFISHL